MKNIDVNKRPWVKNAAIAFLAVMLVLTFFSNTIMNRSLPEVAAQYTQSGTITARIRGSGTVVANENFEVITSQALEVRTVNVNLGDAVSVGDVLITLASKNTGGSDLEIAREELRRLELDLEQFLIMSSPDVNYTALNRAISRARTELSDAQRERAAINYNEASFLQAQSQVNAARATESARKADLEIAEAALMAYDAINPEMEDTPERIALVQAVNAATTANFNAWSARVRIETDTNFFAQETNRGLWISANSRVTMAQDSLESAQEALTNQQRADGRESSIFNITLREKNREIDQKRKEIEELQKDGIPTEITSAVSGVVRQISISSGHQTVPDTPLMVIEVSDRGHTLSIPVTAEQSTRVRIGDFAEVDRGWWSWGNPLTAILTAIRPDPQNPTTNRLLVFSIHGDDLESNTQLNINMAQRSENYSIIVPNSAIRSDTNGEFVLVVMSRSSPLGNRYVATRADVNILASDDTSTAVSGGGLGGWDFVITNSNRPIEPGDQVRLVDNP
ncbi:MAG: hypothetical protein FWD44_04865 [Oscillospiraceae bacterium]|nr:hypothetical protein [Oscillospiraceae bacterium]